MEAEGSDEGEGLCVAHAGKQNTYSTGLKRKGRSGATGLPSLRVGDPRNIRAYHVALLIRTKILERSDGGTWDHDGGREGNYAKVVMA